MFKQSRHQEILEAQANEQKTTEQKNREETEKYCRSQISLYKAATLSSILAAGGIALHEPREVPLAMSVGAVGFGFFSILGEQAYRRCIREDTRDTRRNTMSGQGQ